MKGKLIQIFSPIWIIQGSSLCLPRGGPQKEGIAGVQEHAPDVVILDIRLPDMSGLDGFRREMSWTRCMLKSGSAASPNCSGASPLSELTKEKIELLIAEFVGRIAE
jgi:hypothetical protein